MITCVLTKAFAKKAQQTLRNSAVCKFSFFSQTDSLSLAEFVKKCANSRQIIPVDTFPVYDSFQTIKVTVESSILHKSFDVIDSIGILESIPQTEKACIIEDHIVLSKALAIFEIEKNIPLYMKHFFHDLIKILDIHTKYRIEVLDLNKGHLYPENGALIRHFYLTAERYANELILKFVKTNKLDSFTEMVFKCLIRQCVRDLLRVGGSQLSAIKAAERSLHSYIKDFSFLSSDDEIQKELKSKKILIYKDGICHIDINGARLSTFPCPPITSRLM